MTEAAAVGPVRAVVVTALVVVGTFFLFVGTVGLLRLPDVYNRMHATSKAATLGASSILFAGFVYFGPGGEGLTSLVGILFLFLTAPTGAHVTSRAAQKMGIEFVGRATWPETDLDDGGAGEGDDD
jgi:multicomponent Na+:H+ antiporter subunit G